MNNRKNKLATLGSAVCVALAVLAGPAASLPVQATAAQEEAIMPMSDALTWKYKVENNKLYKRLYNSSTDKWIGSWIYVCDL